MFQNNSNVENYNDIVYKYYNHGIVKTMIYPDNTYYHYYQNGLPKSIYSADKQNYILFYDTGRIKKQRGALFNDIVILKTHKNDIGNFEIYSFQEFHGHYLNGLSTTVDSYYQTITQTLYIDGLRQGMSRTYNINGQLKKICYYKNNHLHGRFILFHLSGMPSEIRTYFNGYSCEYKKIYDKHGNILTYTTLFGKSYIQIEYTNSSKISHVYNKYYGIRHGQTIDYNSTGHIKNKIIYNKNSPKVQNIRTYDKNNKLQILKYVK